MQLQLNSKRFLRPITLKTWGEWLDRLDSDSGTTGQIVTVVRFDGVEEPAYRAPVWRSRTLDGAGSLHVETAPRARLIEETSRDGAAMVRSLAQGAASIGSAFRQEDLTAACQMLPQLVDGIRGVLTLTDSCAAALGVPRPMLRAADRPFDEWMERFGHQLAVLLEAQASEDWLTVADSLEYEIAPALDEWGGAFEHLASLARSA